MRTKKWVLFWAAVDGSPELYIATASGGGYFETSRVELARSFEFPRDAYAWAARRASLTEWRVGLR